MKFKRILEWKKYTTRTGGYPSPFTYSATYVHQNEMLPSWKKSIWSRVYSSTQIPLALASPTTRDSRFLKFSKAISALLLIPTMWILIYMHMIQSAASLWVPFDIGVPCLYTTFHWLLDWHHDVTNMRRVEDVTLLLASPSPRCLCSPINQNDFSRGISLAREKDPPPTSSSPSSSSLPFNIA